MQMQLQLLRIILDLRVLLLCSMLRSFINTCFEEVASSNLITCYSAFSVKSEEFLPASVRSNVEH